MLLFVEKYLAIEMHAACLTGHHPAQTQEGNNSETLDKYQVLSETGANHLWTNEQVPDFF